MVLRTSAAMLADVPVGECPTGGSAQNHRSYTDGEKGDQLAGSSGVKAPVDRANARSDPPKGGEQLDRPQHKVNL